MVGEEGEYYGECISMSRGKFLIELLNIVVNIFRNNNKIIQTNLLNI